MKRLLAAIGFLTVLPLPEKLRGDGETLSRSVPLFPLVGLLIGLIAAGFAFLFEALFPPMIVAVLLTGVLALIHGGLHLDGLSDTADGFLSPYGKDRVLEIMKDSRIGAFGCLALVGVLALKAAALFSLPGSARMGAVFLAPLAARCMMVPLLGLLPCAREGGLGSLFSKNRTPWESVWAMLFLLTAAGLAAGIRGGVAALASGAVFLLFGMACRKRIGGFTGDTVGAMSELAEAAVLLTLSATPGGLFL